MDSCHRREGLKHALVTTGKVSDHCHICPPLDSLAVFILEDVLSVQKDNASVLFLYARHIIRLDELGQTFLVRLVMRL